MKQISRYGAYGIVVRSANTILFTKMTSGPYMGLWALPGGKIEFGESPEEALHRELAEEVTLAAQTFRLVQVASHHGEYQKENEPYLFHHVGVLYHVEDYHTIEGATPEDEYAWISLSAVDRTTLSPFAQTAVQLLQCNR